MDGGRSGAVIKGCFRDRVAPRGVFTDVTSGSNRANSEAVDDALKRPSGATSFFNHLGCNCGSECLTAIAMHTSNSDGFVENGH